MDEEREKLGPFPHEVAKGAKRLPAHIPPSALPITPPYEKISTDIGKGKKEQS